MKRCFSLFAFLLFFAVATTQAQNTTPYWSLAGNSNTDLNSKLGTTNATPLNFITNNMTRLKIYENGRLGVGGRITNLNAPRVLNLADDNAVMRILRTHPSYAPAVELISRTSADGANVAYWDFYAEPSDKSFRIRDRVMGGSGLDRLTISGTGNVGIGTTAPIVPLDIVSSDAAVVRAINTFSGLTNNTGIVGSFINSPGYGIGVIGTGGFRGVEGEAHGEDYTGSVTGVLGISSGYSGVGTRTGIAGLAVGGYNAYGVYGNAVATNGTQFTAAGYFNGTVWAYYYNSLSDRKFKDDIQPLRTGLSELLKLRPMSYQFKTSEYKSLRLPKGRQLGLIADEVKQIFPELVEKGVHPAEYDEKDRTKVIHPEVEYEGVNYQGFIPVLIASVQEQQQQITERDKKIDELTKRNDNLEARLQKLEALLTRNNNATSVNVSSAYLEQNAPNPSRGTTTIRYWLPDGISSARLTLTNSKGQLIKSVNLNSRGTGQVNLDTSALSAGVYNYTLLVEGREMDSKQLVITR